ncbi:MAG: acyl--CoA ligase [Sphingomonadaceae bacterium]|nr:acyl--CoA ligase [Sphingomonadaceae bacterium]
MPIVRRLTDVLKIRASRQPDQIAHDDTRRAISFAEWDREADEISGGLAAAGLRPGDRVFLPISNTHAVEHAVAAFAVLRAGGIVVPINTRFAAAEIRGYAELTRPRFAIYDSEAALAELTLDRAWHVASMPRDLAALPDQSKLDAEADAEILATSGTTGKIKGVVVSHPDLLGDATGLNMDRSRSTLHALPFTGSGGNLGVMILPVKGGATTYTQPKFDPAGFAALVAEKRPETVYLVPTMLRLILDLPDIANFDFSSMKWLMTGTAPLPHDSVMRAKALWPQARIRNSYGMSEGSFGLVTRSEKSVLKPGCVGPMNANVQVRDDQGGIAAIGQVGEVFGLQKHPRRYWGDDQASRDTFPGGWTKTGDLGFVDDDGDLILCGRSKELIIRGGYNITPMEIETVLHDHPAVKDAAVVGIDHEVLGEDVAAAVTFKAGMSASVAELTAYARQRLADNKVPRTIMVLKELPLNQTGKVLKRELKPLLQEEAARAKTDRGV